MTDEERLFEEDRLDRVQRYIDKTLEESGTTAARMRASIIEERHRMWDDYPHAGINEEDTVSLTQANQTMQMNLEQYERMEKLKYVLAHMLDEPYFARLDFQEDGYSFKESFYIGPYSLIDKKSSEILVCDWRADVSSMYYDAQVGRASYQCPMGKIEGELSLRRQFRIENGELLSMFDNDIAIMDGLLQAELGKNSDAKMKTIVNTIQKEQNEVIRELACDLLLVQGTAGSGKTSVALHRLAYLLYKYRKSMSSKNIMIFSPSNVFNAYIADVLPYLGEERVVQTDFYTFFADVTGCDVSDFAEQTEALLRGDDPRRETAVQIKGSYEFARALEAYYNDNLQNAVSLRDLVFWDDCVIYTKEELEYLFFDKYKGYTVEVRKRKIADCMLEEVPERYETSRKAAYRREITQGGLLSVRDEVLNVEIDAYWERDLERLTAELDALLSFDALAVYEAFLREQYPDLVPGEGALPYEDMFPVVYLLLLGGKIAPQLKVAHVVVDEAQDHDPIRYLILSRMFPSAKFTVLGDIAQSIRPSVSAIADLAPCFNAKKMRSIVLNKGYRSTAEINEFAQKLRSDDGTEWFLRHGDAPQVVKIDSFEADLAEQIRVLRDKGMKSVMVLTRTAAEAEEVWNGLRQTVDAVLVREDDVLHTGDVSVMPVYLSKGLECDAAVVADAGTQWNTERDRQMLYVACTRPLHRLTVCYRNELTTFLRGE